MTLVLVLQSPGGGREYCRSLLFVNVLPLDGHGTIRKLDAKNLVKQKTPARPPAAVDVTAMLQAVTATAAHGKAWRGALKL